jgi:uncharacterized membrane protein
MMNKLKRYFITGLVVLLPTLLTIYIMVIVFNFADGVLGRFLNTYLKNTLGFYIPGLGLILSVIIVLTTGFLASHLLGRKFAPYLENIFLRTPLINKIYPTLKQIVLFILRQEEFGFKRVVLVQYPSKGLWSLAFVTNESFKEMDDKTKTNLLCVFVPSSPGPLTGFTIFVAKEEVIFLDISVEDAMKIIISGGIFKP